MDANFEQVVKERAYALWIEAGMVHGLDRVHWLAAETTMKRVAQPTETVASAATKPAATKKATKAATKAVSAKSGSQKAAAPAMASTGGSKVAGKSGVFGARASKSGVSMTASSAAANHPAN